MNPREKFARDPIVVNVLGNWKAVEGASHASYDLIIWWNLFFRILNGFVVLKCRLGREKSVAVRKTVCSFVLILVQLLVLLASIRMTSSYVIYARNLFVFFSQSYIFDEVVVLWRKYPRRFGFWNPLLSSFEPTVLIVSQVFSRVS